MIIKEYVLLEYMMYVVLQRWFKKIHNVIKYLY